MCGPVRLSASEEWQSAAGIPWLFANLALASFIKFKDSQATAIAVTVVLGVGCLYFFLSHGRWLRYVSGFSQSDMQSHLKVRKMPIGSCLRNRCFTVYSPQTDRSCDCRYCRWRLVHLGTAASKGTG